MKDYILAIKWYTLAAEQGDPLAQGNLGIMYYYGKGVEKNDLYAYAWLSQALRGGFKEAQEGIDFLVKSMTPEDIEKAKRQAERFRKKIMRKGKGKK
jgi:hypothetical protein